MTDDVTRFFVLTGGPGSGKSALIDALARGGYAHVPEAGRAIIREQVAAGGRALPWVDPAAFAELMLARDIRAHRNAQHRHGLVFFDRGVPDVAGYMRLSGLAVPPYLDEAAKTFRYNARVFIMPPWRDIFTQDSERKQDFDEAVRTYEMLATTYTDYDYALTEVPRVPIEQRTRFILQNAGGRLTPS